jgi:hypothetical protein
VGNGGEPDRVEGWDLVFLCRLELDRTLIALAGVVEPVGESLGWIGGGLDQSEAFPDPFGCEVLLYLRSSVSMVRYCIGNMDIPIVCSGCVVKR